MRLKKPSDGGAVPGAVGAGAGGSPGAGGCGIGAVSGGAVARITGSKMKEVVITDSIQPTKEVLAARNIRVLPIATLIGEAIGRTAAEESVSSLFD